MNDVTKILSKMENGDFSRSSQLLPFVYDELRKLANAKVGREKPGALQATALVHEAYLRLVDVKEAQHWNSRGHFFAAAAEAMRRIVVDHARHKNAIKRGGGAEHHELNESLIAGDLTDDMLELDDALSQLAKADDAAAELVKLHVFAGRTIAESAEFIGISERTAARRWAFARAWLIRQMGKTE